MTDLTTSPSVTPNQRPAPNRRWGRLGIALLATGGLLSVASVTGVLAVFSDAARHGPNSYASAPVAPPYDLRINQHIPSLGGPILGTLPCSRTTDDVTLPGMTFDAADIGTAQPGAALTEWHVFCAENVGRAQASVSVRIIDAVDAETGCTNVETQVDTTCGPASNGGPQPGELGNLVMLEVASLPVTACRPTATTTGFALGFPSLGTVGFRLGAKGQPESQRCVAYRLIRAEGTTENQIQAAQSDRLTWRLELSAAEFFSTPSD